VAAGVGKAFARWPESFASSVEAVEFFGGPSLRAEAWTEGLVERGGRLWSWFDSDEAVRTLWADLQRPLWDEWQRIACPTLVVRGENGDLDEATAAKMAARLPSAELATIPGAGHELHLEAPRGWRSTLDRFLDSLEG
jgi:pimeloyl-ACP methyl ester carboxylesterase